MIKPLVSTTILSCLMLNIYASDVINFNEQLQTSIDNGSVEIQTYEEIQITPEIAEMIRQINNADMNFKRPILIFSDEGIMLNDSKKLDEVLSRTHDTITSM